MTPVGTTNRPFELIEAASGLDLSHAAALFAEYAASLDGGAHMSLHHQGFEHELATLPGRYSRPSGLILLALVDHAPVGCVALREIPPMPSDTGRVCEMKRMYVKPQCRGLGVGRALATRLISEAAAIGYSHMKLDTEPEFNAAVGLYRSLGFAEIPRYNDDPVECTMYLGKSLGDHNPMG
jgi:ribosomal protein S18 acetylase RimI-like enzyme